MASIKSNFVYNLINTVSGLLFPLITFPYASRIIMAEGIGQVQFYTSVINYVVLLTGLGIPLYGIREIARVRDDSKLLQKTTTEVLLLNLILNLFGYLAIAIMCMTVAKIQVNIPLFLLLSSSIVLSTIGCQWFYSGIEDFKYITIRGLIIKTLCAILLFTIVKNEDDLLYYGAYTVLGYIGNNVLNFIRLKKYITFSEIDWNLLNPWKHIRPAVEIFVFNLITSIYLNLDTVMVGFIKNAESVGYYTAATKLSHMIVALVTSLGAVMLPRLSNLINNNRTDEFYRLANKSYRLIILISFPVCFGLIAMSSTLVHLFSGDTFEPAILTLRIISPIIVAIAISNLVGMQILYPMGKIKIVTISTCVGATLNFMLNCMLIPQLAQNGAAIATVFAEFSVTITQIVCARKYIPFKLFNKSFFLYLCASIFMLSACYVIEGYILSDFVKLLVIPLSGAIVFLSVVIIFRDNMTFEIVNTLKNKIIHK